MWLFLVETYLFVLVAFTLGVAVGLVGVRVGVRRRAPATVRAPKPPKEPSQKKGRGRKGGTDQAPEAEAATTPAPGGAA
jgi:hypothetical protein